MSDWIFITGGAQRIGKAIAEHFHHNNWNVIIHYRNSEKEAIELKQKLNSVRENSFEIIKADLDDSASVEVLCKKVLEISPNLKAIINNASTFYPKEISEIEEEDWSALLSSNLKAPMFICKFLGERLKKNTGSIVNITDIYAESGLARYATYTAAKAGLLNMTKSLASELAPEVLVNSVAPGVILWDVGNEPDEEKKEEILKKVPLRRMGSVEDIVMMVDYLVTKNSYMTGRNINVDGGKSLG
ncbi:SDR family oxidoreductase [SAR86 cluster bacterium]|jgi:pteridine reductase|uniref:SDR family oxidoreductase n=1 Tax=SAR86 cluster bacterium TaxID=2030880 RepID=A0A9Q8TYD5_9GAMM|nr:SDR family oxidoreductase [SAR86 cluster bacterium]